jgi:DNA-binding response OmpR family regulator
MVAPASNGRILVIDDERVIADTLATIFSRSGYESRATYSAESAILVLEKWLPHLAVIDVVLPRNEWHRTGDHPKGEVP